MATAARSDEVDQADDAEPKVVPLVEIWSTFARADCAARVLVEVQARSLADARDFAANETGEAIVVPRNDLKASVVGADRQQTVEATLARAESATER